MGYFRTLRALRGTWEYSLVLSINVVGFLGAVAWKVLLWRRLVVELYSLQGHSVFEQLSKIPLRIFKINAGYFLFGLAFVYLVWPFLIRGTYWEKRLSLKTPPVDD